MNTQEAIKFVESEKSSTYTNIFNQKYDEVKGLLRHGDKLEKMWNWFKDSNGSLIIMYPSHKKTIREFMDEAEVKFLGSRPETRVEKFNKIIQRVYNSYVYANEKVNDERENIVGMLVKLRDEEENV